jgi:hypothetical protein
MFKDYDRLARPSRETLNMFKNARSARHTARPITDVLGMAADAPAEFFADEVHVLHALKCPGSNWSHGSRLAISVH